MRPKLLDLFCGAGGAAMGYHRAGFEVVGIDIKPQPRYPFEFIQADALSILRNGGTGWRRDGRFIAVRDFAAIHASPPCHDHTRLRALAGMDGTAKLLAETRTELVRYGTRWVIENTSGAPMRADYKLCGCMVGLPRLRRERWFETSWHGFAFNLCHDHTQPYITVAGHPGGTSTRDGAAGKGSTADWSAAMGIDWMTARELAQAIPPAYTEFIGEQLLAHLGEVAA